eukprot:jgi/Psemu1/27216/gm1.27216_g
MPPHLLPLPNSAHNFASFPPALLATRDKRLRADNNKHTLANFQLQVNKIANKLWQDKKGNCSNTGVTNKQGVGRQKLSSTSLLCATRRTRPSWSPAVSGACALVGRKKGQEIAGRATREAGTPFHGRIRRLLLRHSSYANHPSLPPSLLSTLLLGDDQQVPAVKAGSQQCWSGCAACCSPCPSSRRVLHLLTPLHFIPIWKYPILRVQQQYSVADSNQPAKIKSRHTQYTVPFLSVFLGREHPSTRAPPPPPSATRSTAVYQYHRGAEVPYCSHKVAE